MSANTNETFCTDCTSSTTVRNEQILTAASLTSNAVVCAQRCTTKIGLNAITIGMAEFEIKSVIVPPKVEWLAYMLLLLLLLEYYYKPCRWAESTAA